MTLPEEMKSSSYYTVITRGNGYSPYLKKKNSFKGQMITRLNNTLYANKQKKTVLSRSGQFPEAGHMIIEWLGEQD